jgi:hypothetical protein
MAGTPPDLVITAYCKVRQSGAQVGVGWTQDDGSISLVLNPGAALIYDANVSYKVKPKDAVSAPREARPAYGSFRQPNFGGAPARNPATPAKRFDDFDDDIPF